MIFIFVYKIYCCFYRNYYKYILYNIVNKFLIHYNFDNNVIIVIDLGIKFDNTPLMH